MGLYTDMFLGFNEILPGREARSSPDRPAFFFAVSWLGYLLVADVVLFGQALPGVFGRWYTILGVFVLVSIYAGHVVYFWRSIVYDDKADADARSKGASGARTALAVAFVAVGWCAAFGGAVLLLR
ncbi:MAG: hypothetical protein JNM50_01035 [Chromatiales bacterium]|jgi:hypothetical protein|nr:hypothetical protein [Chromatiales bacterium]